MGKWVLYISVFVMLPVLLSGCRTRRQEGRRSETVTVSAVSGSDSVLFQQLNRLIRNRTMQLEHVVFARPDSQQAIPVVQSITRLVASEETDQHADLVLDAVKSMDIAGQTTTVTEQKSSVSSSWFGWWKVGIVFFLVAGIGFVWFRRRFSCNFVV